LEVLAFDPQSTRIYDAYPAETAACRVGHVEASLDSLFVALPRPY
jgi:hypothetical protein